MRLLLSLTALSLILWRLRARRQRSTVSPRWLSALDRQSTRVEYHGPHVHRKWVE